MLKGLHPLLGPELLHVLASMGHGDEIGVVDANFPTASLGKRVIRLDGASAPTVLEAMLTLLPLPKPRARPRSLARSLASRLQRVQNVDADVAATLDSERMLQAVLEGAVVEAEVIDVGPSRSSRPDTSRRKTPRANSPMDNGSRYLRVTASTARCASKESPIMFGTETMITPSDVSSAERCRRKSTFDS